MDVAEVLDRLADAGVSVWLDSAGKLLIDKDAPAELKDLVRAHKQELMDVRRAQAIINRPGMRSIRLPLGNLAVAYPPKADVEEIRWAMGVLRMDSLPLVINDEGLKWLPYPAQSETILRQREGAKLFAAAIKATSRPKVAQNKNETDTAGSVGQCRS